MYYVGLYCAFFFLFLVMSISFQTFILQQMEIRYRRRDVAMVVIALPEFRTGEKEGVLCYPIPN
jgi:hypothetical protein